jgi:hypothetical protein
MSLGTKIADKIPDSVLVYVTEHPTALTVVTFALTVVTLSLFYTACDLDIRANDFRRARLGEMQRAASEALGG